MSDDEFAAFLVLCRDELGTKQAAFQHRIEGASKWFYEMADATLAIENAVFGMTPIGTYSADYNTWLWGVGE
jgi:hypothetical protein